PTRRLCPAPRRVLAAAGRAGLPLPHPVTARRDGADHKRRQKARSSGRRANRRSHPRRTPARPPASACQMPRLRIPTLLQRGLTGFIPAQIPPGFGAKFDLRRTRFCGILSAPHPPAPSPQNALCAAQPAQHDPNVSWGLEIAGGCNRTIRLEDTETTDVNVPNPASGSCNRTIRLEDTETRSASSVYPARLGCNRTIRLEDTETHTLEGGN